MKTFWKNMQRVLTGEDAATVFTKASSESVESLAKTMVKGGADDLAKTIVKNGADDLAGAGAKVAAKTGIFAKAGAAISKKVPALGKIASKLKGKGGSIAIAISLALEIPTIIQAFKNGDGLQQLGRSAIGMGGMAAGAAIGSAIGSIIPGAGTVIGGLIGGALGIVGSIFGGEAAKKAGDAVFGKSIQEQKDEAAEAQAEQAEAVAAQPASTSTSYVPSSDTEAIKTTASKDVLYTYGFQPLLDTQA